MTPKNRNPPKIQIQPPIENTRLKRETMWTKPIIILIFGTILGLAFGLILNPLIFLADRVEVHLWLEVMHRVLTGIGGLGTFIALIFLYRQFHLLQAQSDLVQKNIAASLDAQLYVRLDSFNRFVFEHSREYDLLDSDYTQIDSMEERSKLHRMCELGYTFFEEIYKHHIRMQLLETEDWEEWQQNLIHFFEKPYVRGYWKKVAPRYAISFQGMANQVIKKIETIHESKAKGTRATLPNDF